MSTPAPYTPGRYVGRRFAPVARPASPYRAGGAPGAAVPRASRRVWRERIRWTLVFSSFFAFVGGVVASRLAIGQPMMVLGLLGVLMQTEPLRIGPVPTLLAGWTLWGALGYFMSPHPDAVWNPLVQLMKLCVITLVGINALRTRAQIRAYCAFVLFAFLIYPGRGALLNWMTGANVVAGSRAIWNGVYANPNDLAGICLLLLSIALAVAVGERDRRFKLAALGTAGFIAFIIFITQSRGALIALGVFVLVALQRMPKKQRLRAVLVAGVLGAVVVFFAPSSVWNRLSGLKNATNTDNLSQVDAEGSAEQRFEIWKVASTIIAEHPVTGVGIGAYNDEHGEVAQRPQFKPTAHGRRDTHSMYLNVLAETGVPGFLVFASLLLVTVRSVERVRRRIEVAFPNDALQLQFLELGLLALCIAAIWGSYAKLNMLYLQLVLMWAMARLYEREAFASGALKPVRRQAR